MALPLEDIRVVAVEQFGAGPWATLQLADLGAEVIKIEDPATGGDVARYVPPYQSDEHSLYFETLNRNKKSVSLDLRSDEGKAVIGDLARHSDAVYNNLRGGQQERLGLTYAHLGQFNPKIVCCTLTAYGMTGPRADAGGYDYLMQGLAGWMSLTGEPDSPPSKSGLSLVDFASGYVSAIALLSGIWRARRDGVGCDCDVSLHETALALLTYVGTWVATEGYVPDRLPSSAHPSLVPFQNFRASDGWFVIACGKEKFWRRLCAAIGNCKMANDPRFCDFRTRAAHRAELLETLQGIFATRPVGHWVSLLECAAVPVARVNTVAEALADDQVRARGAVVEFEHPVFGKVKEVASPLRVADAPRAVGRGPFRGEQTRTVLSELCGYSEDQLNMLEQFGTIEDSSDPVATR